MDDFASDTDSDYTSYWRDWVSLPAHTLLYPFDRCKNHVRLGFGVYTSSGDPAIRSTVSPVIVFFNAAQRPRGLTPPHKHRNTPSIRKPYLVSFRSEMLFADLLLVH